MTTTSTRFYQIGGSLLPNAPSYVTRRADDELYDGLVQGEFCYVFTTRVSEAVFTEPICAPRRPQTSVLPLTLPPRRAYHSSGDPG